MGSTSQADLSIISVLLTLPGASKLSLKSASRKEEDGGSSGSDKSLPESQMGGLALCSAQRRPILSTEKGLFSLHCGTRAVQGK